jgi:CBS domain containing-hemolysin-like protein
MSESYFGYRLLLLGAILAANAFFAGAEAALLSVRRTRLAALAEEGQAGAQSALSLLANPERLLSVVQVGVTLASLGMGWAGEPAIFGLIVHLAGPVITPVMEPWIHGAAFVLAFLIMTYLHVVLGEVVPKNLALEKADRLAVLVAPVLLVFYRISEPFVYVIERSATGVSKMLGLTARTQGGGHSAEELKYIISFSRIEGHLLHFEEEAIRKLLDLRNYYAREIMVPRNDIASVPVEATLDEVLRSMNEHQYSRLPVYEGSPERIIGIVYFKDLMRLWLEQRSAAATARAAAPVFRIRRMMRSPLVVPETKPLNQLIDEFRTRRSHMALVVDEFGTIAGLVTLEDVLEQIFGEIEDEHDVRRQIAAVSGVFEVEGATPIRDLESHYGIELPEGGYETLAGFLLFKFGYIPSAGELVEYDGHRYTVTQMARNRIAMVRIERLAGDLQPSTG